MEIPYVSCCVCDQLVLGGEFAKCTRNEDAALTMAASVDGKGSRLPDAQDWQSVGW
jgi:hypothetical protein